MNILEMVKTLREYYEAALGQGFKPAEAMDLTKAYQFNLMQNDLLERMQRKDPWENP
jgi:hypothetical protein